MTKDELIKDNARLQNELATSESKNKERLNVFAKILWLYKTEHKTYWDNKIVNTLESWGELYFVIGKLKQQAEQKEYMDRVEFALDEQKHIREDVSRIREDILKGNFNAWKSICR